MARDNRGRYHSVKSLDEIAPGAAHGCAKCKFGIVGAPELTGVVSLSMERIVQLIDETIQFCSCRAGQWYWASLMNRRQALIEEARNNPMINLAAGDKPIMSHPEIDTARHLVHAAYGKREPTFHYDGTAVRGPKDDDAQ